MAAAASAADLLPHLKYLNDAAHLLAISSPSASSYLMSRCNGLLFDNELEQPASQRRNTCGGCGNIMILGISSNIKLESTRPERSRRIRRLDKKKLHWNAVAATKSVVYICKACGRKTRHNINSPTPRTPIRPPSKAPAALNASPSTSPVTISRSETPTPAAANASSKKRAKARKQGGLQALLAKNREDAARGTAGGFGLDLLDFMKK